MARVREFLSSKRALFCAGAALIAVLGLVVARSAPSPLEKGGAWLLGYGGAMGDPGVPWGMKVIGERMCAAGNGAGERAREAFVREFSGHETEKWYAVLMGVGIDGAPPPSVLEGREAAFDNVLLPIVYCGISDPGSGFYEEVFDTRRASGYALTHKLLALRFARNAGCAVPSSIDIEASAREAALKIRKEMDGASRFSDLLAEQAAFLYYTGNGDLVSSEHMRLIERAQNPDGGWPDDRFKDGASRPHPTMLAVWALAEHRGSCPF